MSWNYRIVKRTLRDEDGNALDVAYYFVEAFYDENGKVCDISEDPQHSYGETVSELRLDWIRKVRAFTLPILDYDNIPEPGALPFEGNDEDVDEDAINEELKSFNTFTLEDLGINQDDLDDMRKDDALARLSDEEIHKLDFVGKDSEEVLNRIIHELGKADNDT